MRKLSLRQRLNRIKNPALFRHFLPKKPVSRQFGCERGTAIDRYYIDRFLEQNSKHIQGDILEVAETTYTQMFTKKICSSKYLAFNPDPNPNAIVGDLMKPETLPSGQFDCFICTQTFQYIEDIKKGIASVLQLLRPGGVFLGTMPGISQKSTTAKDNWYDLWRFNQKGIERNFIEMFGKNQVKTEVFGNVYVAAAFLYGLTLEDVPKKQLDLNDPDYEFLITVFAQKKWS